MRKSCILRAAVEVLEKSPKAGRSRLAWSRMPVLRLFDKLFPRSNCADLHQQRERLCELPFRNDLAVRKSMNDDLTRAMVRHPPSGHRRMVDATAPSAGGVWLDVVSGRNAVPPPTSVVPSAASRPRVRLSRRVDSPINHARQRLRRRVRAVRLSGSPRSFLLQGPHGRLDGLPTSAEFVSKVVGLS